MMFIMSYKLKIRRTKGQNRSTVRQIERKTFKSKSAALAYKRNYNVSGKVIKKRRRVSSWDW
jgi:hypothetical protein